MSSRPALAAKQHTTKNKRINKSLRSLGISAALVNPQPFSDFCVQRKERFKEIKAKFLVTIKVAWRKQTANSQARPVWRTSRHAHGVCFGILQISRPTAHFPDWEAVLPGNRAAFPGGPRPVSQTWCSVSGASSPLSANPHQNSAPSFGQSMT